MNRVEYIEPEHPKAWTESTLMVGDLVNTEYGLAVITEDCGERESYSVFPLPGCKRKKQYFDCGSVTTGPKWAWYGLEELELIEKGSAHKLRDKEADK